MSQVEIAAIALAVFVGFMIGYSVDRWQRRRLRRLAIEHRAALRAEYRAELEVDDIEARVRRFQP